MMTIRTQLWALVGAALLWTALGVAPSVSAAQDTPKTAKKAEKRRKKPRNKRAKERAAAEPKPPAEPKKPAQGTSEKSAGSTAAAPSARDSARAAAQDAAQGANSEIVKEGDSSVKVMQFSGLDIEGRLKSPQLLYFVNRVRAEFDRPRLPHRSFMPELQQSTETEPLR